MIPDNKLFLNEKQFPGARGSAVNSSSMMASAGKSNGNDWYDYESLITVDTAAVKVLVYPNPFQEKIFVQFYKDVGPQPVFLYDFSGRAVSHTVLEAYDSEAELDYSNANLVSGVYFLTIGKYKFKLFKRD